MEFLHVDSLDNAREKLLECAKDWLLTTEVVSSNESLGRVLSKDIVSSDNIPPYRRSIVDGYAVSSADTASARDGTPVVLSVKGAVEMGSPALFSIESGECAEIFTGSMVPDGADAAVMVEYSEPACENSVQLFKGVSFGENVVQIGEDVKSNERILMRGRIVKPEDIGTLAAAGVTDVFVYAPVRITIISTGDELVSSDQLPKLGQIRDVNTPALAALARKNGFSVVRSSVLSDDLFVLEKAALKAMADSEIVIISGGSSKGKMDLTRCVFDRVSNPGVFTHGLAMKPGKPSILGFDDVSKTVLVGLPGHPVAALLVFELLLCWLVRELSGLSMPFAIPARVSCNIASASGRQSCWLTRLVVNDGEYIADPIFGKSGLISTLSSADGYFLVDRNKEGLNAGETVFVYLL